jgi:GTP-binding protein HflX
VRKVEGTAGALVLADTVGFVRDLPHDLVAAFRSTLAEARDADLLLHVVDAADPLREERIGQVDAVLAEIGAGDIPQILVYNKIDKLDGATPRHDEPHAAREKLWVSARTGDGVEALRTVIARRFSARQVTGELRLASDQGRLRARLFALDAVRAEHADEHGWRLEVDLPLAIAERLAAEPGGHSLAALLLVGPDAPTYNPDVK